MSQIGQDRVVAGGIRRLACMIPLLGCMMLLPALGAASSSWPEATGLGADDADLDPAKLTLGSDGVEVRLAGDLAEGTARRLRVLLRAHPGIRVLSLESDGGLVDEAEQIGDLVAAHGLSTVVREACVSACTLAFVRARERMMASGAKLGFHAPWAKGKGGREEQQASDDERQAYVAAGVAAEFADEALAVPSSSIWFPEDGRLLRAGVVTAILTEAELPARIAAFGGPGRLASTATQEGGPAPVISR